MPPSSPPTTRRSGNAPPRGSSSGGGANRPLYAIDFTAVACGKRIANTKRRVRWRFGFANPDALASGETGTACRGEEHDVTFVWSVTSGKRLILADGQEVHYSSSRSAVIDFSWTMRGNHVLKVIAHATAPMTAEPGFRQYDFFVDGRSFFTFPKVYRLGLTGGAAGTGKTVSPDRGVGRGVAEVSVSTRRSNSANIAQIEAPHNPDEVSAPPSSLRKLICLGFVCFAEGDDDFFSNFHLFTQYSFILFYCLLSRDTRPTQSPRPQ